MELIWILLSIHVYSFGIDRQCLINMNRQVALNFGCGAEEMKQHTQLHDLASGLVKRHTYNNQYFIIVKYTNNGT